jgi:hypothetical protein
VVFCGFGARSRSGQDEETFGESSVGTDAAHLSPDKGRELAPAAPARRSLGGKEPGCCGIVGPGPSATLDKTVLPRCFLKAA